MIVASRVLQIDADGCRATGKVTKGLQIERIKNGTVAIQGEGAKRKIHYME